MERPAPSSPPLPLIRPALELAWYLAKIGSQSRPPLPVPGRLRPLMRAARLPDRMLETVRQVVESDQEFRDRVVAAADEGVLGRSSWLWLVHPEGWEEELSGLVDDLAGAESQKREKRTAEEASRRIAELTSSLLKAQAELDAMRSVNRELQEAAGADRKARREAFEARDAVRQDVSSLQQEIDLLRSNNDELRSQAALLTDQLSDAEIRCSALAMEHDSAVSRIDELEAVIAGEEQRAGIAEAETARMQAVLSKAALTVGELAGELGSLVGGEEPPPGSDGQSRGGSVPGGSVPGGAATGGGGRPAGRARRRERRLPLAFPPATFDDSPEAAAHLVRTPGVLLAVDGYNVTLSSWPGLDLPAQRERLVDSLAELAMRSAAEVHVVFDGVDEGNRLQPPGAVRRRMRVQFSPSEVEADDVIIGLVEALPIDRPVVVATDDGRVRDAVRDKGANVISVDQLLAVLRRSPRG